MNSTVEGCHVCGRLKRPFLCPTCINKGQVGEQKVQISKLLKKREHLLQRLEEKMKNRVVCQEQEARRQEALLKLRKASQRAVTAEARLRQLTAQVQGMKDRNRARRERIERVCDKMKEDRKQQLDMKFPYAYLTQNVSCKASYAVLKEEQTAKIRKILEILPIAISAYKGEKKIPVAVKILNLKLPQGIGKEIRFRNKPEEAGTALGYVLRLLELLSLYGGGPVLHCSGFQCSTSYIWQGQTFRDRQPARFSPKLPLHFGNPGTGHLTRTQSLELPTPSTRHRNRELEAAVHLLHRSIGTFLHAHQVKEHEGWGPFEYLAKTAAQQGGFEERHKQGSRHKRPSSSHRSVSVVDAGMVEENMGVWADEVTSPLAEELSASILLEDEDEEDPDASLEEGWCHVESSVLPPRPSQADDVQHYEQAFMMGTQDIRPQQPASRYRWTLEKLSLDNWSLDTWWKSG